LWGNQTQVLKTKILPIAAQVIFKKTKNHPNTKNLKAKNNIKSLSNNI
jgi:hypothetical protein